jgi:NADPH:quinone reductase
MLTLPHQLGQKSVELAELDARLMVQGLTALYLTRQIPPRGKTVLVNAAAGGVGSLLVQLAKRAGAKTVIAAAGTDEKLDFARSLGADACVNYTRTSFMNPLAAT